MHIKKLLFLKSKIKRKRFVTDLGSIEVSAIPFRSRDD